MGPFAIPTSHRPGHEALCVVAVASPLARELQQTAPCESTRKKGVAQLRLRRTARQNRKNQNAKRIGEGGEMDERPRGFRNRSCLGTSFVRQRPGRGYSGHLPSQQGHSERGAAPGVPPKNDAPRQGGNPTPHLPELHIRSGGLSAIGACVAGALARRGPTARAWSVRESVRAARGSRLRGICCYGC